MKEKIKNAISRLEHKTAGVLYRLCGGLSPIKRFVIVLILGVAFLSAYAYVLISSIYNLGRRSVEIELLRMQEFENQYFDCTQQPNQESINILNCEEYGYE